MNDLSAMYGREGEAIARYHQQRTGENWTLPDDCDLCRQKLPANETAPQTIHWRTKPKLVSTEHKLMVTVETRKYYQQSGTYFLCADCRKIMRPLLKEQLPRVLLPVAISIPLALWLGGDLPLALVLVFPGLVLGTALLWQMRSRFGGYPASIGFRLHETTFDGPEQRMIMPVFILLFLCLIGAGLLGGGSGIPTDEQLGRLDGPGGTGTIRMAEIRGALKELYQVSPERPAALGDTLVKGWFQHKQRADHLYPTTPDFIRAVSGVLRGSKPKGGGQEAVDLVTADTAGRRLLRLQGASGDPIPLDAMAGRVAAQTHSSAWQVVQATEQVGVILKQLGTPVSLLAVLKLLDETSVKMPGRPLAQVVDAAQSDLFAHPEQYR